jgi:hypothetical protein
MKFSMFAAACALAAAVATAGAARADDADLRAELEALKRRVAEQERTLRTLDASAPSQDELQAAVASYLATAPAVAYVGGDEGGKAGFPMGKKPFIEQGPNKLEIGARWQVRYSAFLYSDDAIGTVSDGATPPNFSVSDAAPRDRSGFELERLLLDFGGTIFCKDISFLMQFDFDADGGSGINKRFAYVDWKYSGEHHVRAGSDRAPYGYETNNSSGALAFVDRSIVSHAFDILWSTGVSAWGYFGPCDCPKQFLYKVAVGNGEGRSDQEGGTGQGSVFNRDAMDTYSDNLLFSGMLEWVITCNEYKWDEVDARDCDKRCEFQAALGASAYYENDDDSQHAAWGSLALRSTGRAERTGLNAWFRMQYQGFSFLLEGHQRSVEYSSGALDQVDQGVHALLHYRFADSNWGLGVRGGMIFLDDNYAAVAVGAGAVPIEDTITEFGVVVNYFFWNHNNKLSLDVNWVQDNSGVNTSSGGYMFGVNRGVVVEDGVMLRVQWQVAF